MRIVLENEKEFLLLPDTEEDRVTLQKVQLGIASGDVELHYLGRSDGEDKHLRFNVGGSFELLRRRDGKKLFTPQRVPTGGTSLVLRLRGENVDEAVGHIKYLVCCSYKITVTKRGDGLLCTATAPEKSANAMPIVVNKRRS